MKVTKLGAKGFSLVELMVVVAIIGILAAVAIPQYQNFQAKARMSESQAQLGGLYTAETAYVGMHAQYFADFRDIGYAPSGQINYHVGFNAAGGINSPGDPNYPGPTAPGAAATEFNTATLMGTGLVAVAGRAVALTAGTVGAIDMFTAQANGNIDADPAPDTWTIDQFKAITHTSNDLIL